jgi:hypothetical protein
MGWAFVITMIYLSESLLAIIHCKTCTNNYPVATWSCPVSLQYWKHASPLIMPHHSVAGRPRDGRQPMSELTAMKETWRRNATQMHGRWCPGMEEWPWLRGWKADRQQLFLLCFVCESVHAIMGILLSELDSCPDVEALSCLVKLKLTLARNGACIYTAHSSFDMRTASRYQSLGCLCVVFRCWYY